MRPPKRELEPRVDYEAPNWVPYVVFGFMGLLIIIGILSFIASLSDGNAVCLNK